MNSDDEEEGTGLGEELGSTEVIGSRARVSKRGKGVDED